MLTSAGYVHYEVSNFAHPGRESVHNTGYWTGRDYIGLGAGAHSYLSHPGWGRRWANISDAGTYMAGVERGGSVREFTETLGPGEAMAEHVMLSLRLLGRGIVDADFAALFGVTLSEAFGAALERLVAGGMLEWMDGRLVLTRAGLLVADSVVSTLLAGAGPGAVKG
jgi:oxygen-independent coproporphyrinogen-3 oxidase